MKNKLIIISFCTVILLAILVNLSFASKPNKPTTIKINISEKSWSIDPMIYGQMLEDCNDRIIYGGIVDKGGNENTHVTRILKPLNIPVMRWPAGTFIHEYQWEYGIGPKEKRPVVPVINWGGIENYQFGTDEFLAWCKKLSIEPYINFNMSNHPILGGSLREALNWVDYVNGLDTTIYGRKRIDNGHKEPYGVKYWCIGNENWGPFGVHEPESDTVYSDKLLLWGNTIKQRFPNLSLLAVGHTLEWDREVLKKNAAIIDFLTQHYYVTSKVKDNQIQNAENSLFAPSAFEEHIKSIGEMLNEYNTALNREDNPIRISVDEWNNRHSVFINDKFKFDRHDPRRQYDVAIVAGVLNAFIRQCRTVGMANYIFPVNGHGLVRTVGDSDVFTTTLYPVFKKYREVMVGKNLDLEVNGPGLQAENINFSFEGDSKEITSMKGLLNYIDAAAAMTKDGTIFLSLVNRSHNTSQNVEVSIPVKFTPFSKWSLVSEDINIGNTETHREVVKATEEIIQNNRKKLQLIVPPCGLVILKLIKR